MNCSRKVKPLRMQIIEHLLLITLLFNGCVFLAMAQNCCIHLFQNSMRLYKLSFLGQKEFQLEL